MSCFGLLVNMRGEEDANRLLGGIEAENPALTAGSCGLPLPARMGMGPPSDTAGCYPGDGVLPSGRMQGASGARMSEAIAHATLSHRSIKG
jgi:hypothetical protein